MGRVNASRAKRATQLGVLAGAEATRHVAVKTANRMRSEEAARHAMDARYAQFADRLVAVLGAMGGCTMKLGQLFSMVDAGLVPVDRRAEFQAKLAALQNRGADVPWRKIRPHIEAELGLKLREAFADFDQAPAACASIGQVHRAVLRDGREVAVKVQYPGMEDAVGADIKNLRFMLAMYRWVHPGLDAAAMADEMAQRMTEELDYRNEAANTAELARRYRHHPFVRIPDVIDPLSRRRVIVTEWIAGRPLSDVFDSPLRTRNRVAEIIFRFYIAGAYTHGIFSADPHPGNCLILGDDSVAFLDFGSVQRVDADLRTLELQALRAAAADDADTLADVGFQLGAVSGENCSPPALLDAYRQIFGWYLEDRTAEHTAADANERLATLLIPRNEHERDFNLPASLFLRARADLQVGGILGQLRPHINLYSIAREWLNNEEPSTELGLLEHDWADRSASYGGT